MNKHKSPPLATSRKQNDSLRLGFNELETILNLPLPERAYTDRTWWSNNTGHRHAEEWLEFGWQVQSVDLNLRQVAFERRPGAPKRRPFGCMAGTITIAPGVDLTAPSDEVWNAEAGRLLNE